MRLFIAINFCDNTKSKLQHLCSELRVTSKKGSFTLTPNLHLTLVFLGECTLEEACLIKSVMDKTQFAPFELGIDSIGRFKRVGGDVWWAGVERCEPLQNLYTTLATKLRASGFKIENRKYSPHITLGRRVVTEFAPKEIEAFSVKVCSIELMKSERIDAKLTYTPIHTKTALS